MGNVCTGSTSRVHIATAQIQYIYVLQYVFNTKYLLISSDSWTFFVLIILNNVFLKQVTINQNMDHHCSGAFMQYKINFWFLHWCQSDTASRVTSRFYQRSIKLKFHFPFSPIQMDSLGARYDVPSENILHNYHYWVM